jgi:hypothetical protein
MATLDLTKDRLEGTVIGDDVVLVDLWAELGRAYATMKAKLGVDVFTQNRALKPIATGASRRRASALATLENTSGMEVAR